MSPNESTSHGAEHAHLRFFNPAGMFWRVNRENVLMLGSGYALLLQLAHPLVSAGVDQHSDFLSHPLKRLYRTVRAVQRLSFGDRETALGAARGIQRVHARVQGTLSEETASFPKGTSYHAEDPELLLWVYATLMEAILATYQAFLPPLEDREHAEFFEESKRLARVLGMPEKMLPSDYPAFRRYFNEMVDGPTLEVTPTAARLADAVLHPRLSFVPSFVEAWQEIVTTALMPDPLRQRYRLHWDADRQRDWQRLQRFLRRVLPRLPDLLRAAPAAQWAEYRAGHRSVAASAARP